MRRRFCRTACRNRAWSAVNRPRVKRRRKRRAAVPVGPGRPALVAAMVRGILGSGAPQKKAEGSDRKSDQNTTRHLDRQTTPAMTYPSV